MQPNYEVRQKPLTTIGTQALEPLMMTDLVARAWHSACWEAVLL